MFFDPAFDFEAVRFPQRSFHDGSVELERRPVAASSFTKACFWHQSVGQLTNLREASERTSSVISRENNSRATGMCFQPCVGVRFPDSTCCILILGILGHCLSWHGAYCLH